MGSRSLPPNGGTSSRGCVVSKEFIHCQPCHTSESLQHRRRRRMLSMDQVPDRRLAHVGTLSKLSLSCLSPFEPIAERFHMTPESIGFAYDNAIGPSYGRLFHNRPMAKRSERSFLDRALEALAEKYPRERATQTRLAQLAGVKQPSVHEWGDKDRAPAIPNAVDLAMKLDVCVEWLYTERGPKRPAGGAVVDEHLTPILEAWPKLDPALKRQIARYADFVKDEK